MADQRIQSNERMVGAGHAFRSDTLNRLAVVEHNTDGTHLNAVGQCLLRLSGGNLLLSPWKGSQLTINSARQAIPDAGITLPPSAIAAIDTDYKVYAYMDGTTMKLELSTTGHATQATTGVEIKSGDATRTLVGLARGITGTVYADNYTQRYVRSWFNDPGFMGFSGLTASKNRASATWGELDTSKRVEFLAWTGELIQIIAAGQLSSSSGNEAAHTGIGISGSPEADSQIGVVPKNVTGTPPEDPNNIMVTIMNARLRGSGVQDLTDGAWDARLYGKGAAGSNTFTWIGGVDGTPGAWRMYVIGSGRPGY